MIEPMPDWKLPAGTDRGLWDYLNNRSLAEQYDESLRETPLLRVDLAFCESAFTAPGRLVDLGCGTGRLVRHFARRGFACTGVDLSGPMLEVAQASASREGLHAEWVRANLVELDALADESFDHAACLFSTLGMIRGRGPRLRFLRHVRRILRPGGRFVVHVHHRRFQLYTPGGIRWTLGQWLTGLRGRESGDRTMPQKYGGAELTLHHFTRGEILRDLRESGLEVLRCQPVSTRADGRLPMAAVLPGWRAYGYLLSATRA